MGVFREMDARFKCRRLRSGRVTLSPWTAMQEQPLVGVHRHSPGKRTDKESHDPFIAGDSLR